MTIPQDLWRVLETTDLMGTDSPRPSVVSPVPLSLWIARAHGLEDTVVSDQVPAPSARQADREQDRYFRQAASG